jgi:hypothetical protein
LSVRETAVVTYIVTAILGAAAVVMSQVQLQWAVATLVGIVTSGFVLAYLLLKVDMSVSENKPKTKRKRGAVSPHDKSQPKQPTRESRNVIA